MSIQVTDRPAARRGRVPLGADVAVAGVALSAAVGVWSFCTQVADVHLAVRSAVGGEHVQQVGVGSVVATVVVVSVLGIGLLRLLEWRTARGLQAWTVLAGLVLVVSMSGPLGATSVAAALVLVALHGVVAVVLVLGLRQVRRHACRPANDGVA